MSNSVLIVDDEKGIRFAFARALEKEQYEVFEAETGSEALHLLNENQIDLVLLDVKLPDMSGIEILKQIRDQGLATIVIMMSAFGDISIAVEAMQLGADNFRTKPFNVSEMKNCIRSAIENKKNSTMLESYKTSEKQKFCQDIIGESKPIRYINELIKRIAVSPSTTVLIQGHSGTGKELVARAIHFNSTRRDNRFIEVNCTAIPESLLESELFGHEKGSFTDAKKDHRGIFEQADGGTLFLDEIGDMPIAMQAKLLRVLQEKRFKRVGGSKNISVDVRVIASTNVNLEEAVKKGSFREDLFYRLKVVPIPLPPLKERENDALLIAKYYLNQFCKEFKKSFQGFTPEAEKAIIQYEWPGNIRELKNIIERAVLLENGNLLDVTQLNIDGNQNYDSFNSFVSEPQSSEISPVSSPKQESPSNESKSNGQIILYSDSFLLEDVEKSLLFKALSENQWNRNTVAKIVGMNRTTLYSKIKKYGLEEPQ